MNRPATRGHKGRAHPTTACLLLKEGAERFVERVNNEDGNIGVYTLQADGSLLPGARVAAAGKV